MLTTQHILVSDCKSGVRRRIRRSFSWRANSFLISYKCPTLLYLIPGQHTFLSNIVLRLELRTIIFCVLPKPRTASATCRTIATSHPGQSSPGKIDLGDSVL